MNNCELLMPAGNIEKLKTSIAYGADAVYLGLVDYSLRTMKSGSVIDRTNIKSAVDIAHGAGKKVYCTVNIFAHNSNLRALEEDLDVIKDANVDAVIVGDFGVFNIIKRSMPDMPLHISTQANTLNYEAVQFWKDLGASRVILARELSLKEIAEIHEKVPDIELESLIHGSQCMSYSGRCLLSDFMTKGERRANKGACTQPCRWSYALMEMTRPDEYFPIEETEHGTLILSPKDLCLIKELPGLIKAGVHSFKIEGRTKSMYYAAVVARAYRKALDGIKNNEAVDYDALVEELKKVANRGYTTGFVNGELPEDEYNYVTNKAHSRATFLGVIQGKDGEFFKTLMKFKMNLGEKVEIFSPEDDIVTKSVEIKDIYGNSLDVANTNQEVFIKFEPMGRLENNYENAIIRSVKENSDAV